MNFGNAKSNSDHEQYYLKIIDLQEKLRQSEEERMKLETKFNELWKNKREIEHSQVQFIKNKYNEFLEQDRLRHDRNENILRALDRIEYRAAMLTAKTDRLRMMRKNYELLLMQSYSRYKLDKQQANELKTNLQPNLPPANITQFEIPKINLFQPINSDIYDAKLSKQNNSNYTVTNAYGHVEDKINDNPFTISLEKNSRIPFGGRTNSNNSLMSENSDEDEYTYLRRRTNNEASKMGIPLHENSNTLYPPETDTRYCSTISPTEKTHFKNNTTGLNKSDNNHQLNYLDSTEETIPGIIPQSKQATREIPNHINNQEIFKNDSEQMQEQRIDERDCQNTFQVDLPKNKIQTKSHEIHLDELNENSTVVINNLQRNLSNDLESERNEVLNHHLNLSENYENKLDVNTKNDIEYRLDSQPISEHENFNKIDVSEDFYTENQPESEIGEYNQNELEPDTHNVLQDNNLYQHNEGVDNKISDNYLENSENVEETQQEYLVRPTEYQNPEFYPENELKENYRENQIDPNYEYNEDNAQLQYEDNVDFQQNNYSDENIKYQQETSNYDLQPQTESNDNFYGEKIEDYQNNDTYETNYDYDSQNLNQQENEHHVNSQQQNYQDVQYVEPQETIQNQEYEFPNQEYTSQNQYETQNQEYETQNQEYETQNQEYETQNQEYETQNQEYETQNKEYETKNQEYETQNQEYETQNQEYENYNYDNVNEENQVVQDDYNNYEYAQNNGQLAEKQYENYNYEQNDEQLIQEDYKNYNYDTQNNGYEAEYVQDPNTAYDPQYEENTEQGNYENLVAPENQYQPSEDIVKNTTPPENALGDIVSDYEQNDTLLNKKLPKLAQMLDSDTESIQHSERQASLKDESDFDFNSEATK